MEKLVKPKEKVKEKVKEVEKSEETLFKSKLARSIHKTVMTMKSKTIVRNELFTPGRMAYVIELDDETDADIPTTLIRSKADVPTIDNTPTLTTNDIVINKLAQILSYLRQGNRHGKKGKKNKDGKSRPDEMFNELELAPQRIQDDSIYGDIGDYVPSTTKNESSKSDSKKKKKESYFEKPAPEIEDNAPRLPTITGVPSAGETKFKMSLFKLLFIKFISKL